MYYLNRIMSLIQRLCSLCFLLCCLCQATAVSAQLPNAGVKSNYGNANDSAGKKTNTSDWESEDAFVFYTFAHAPVKYAPDTSIHSMHRRPFSLPWNRDLGNLGSPNMELQFAPQNPIGLSLGYHTFDALRFQLDSLRYYNTTKPYSVFTYNLGSKLEQVAQIIHAQNISPNWNVAVNYRKINSPGYYIIQRNNHDNFNLTTNYTAPSQHYALKAAIVYNKEQHDENGGMLADSFLNNIQYADRKSIPVAFYQSGYSLTRSPVTTLQRDITFLMDHAYTWGHIDTLYNQDSSQFAQRLMPRFRISHRFEMGAQRYQYKDVRPDSLRYASFFQTNFASSDSVFMRQEWFYVDNRLMLNGILGKMGHELVFNAGVGSRMDNFLTLFVQGKTGDNVLSNYLIGSIHKDAQGYKQWAYDAHAQFFVTGAAAGNLFAQAQINKDWGKYWGAIQIGLRQQLNNAPFNFTTYQNQFWARQNSFDKESSTLLYAQYQLPSKQWSISFKHYLLANYLYFDAQQMPQQSSSAFNLNQISLRKQFNFGRFTLDNEILYQQVDQIAPIHLPTWLGRHQLAIESFVFKHQLKIATGLEVRYHSSYYANGYSPFFNQFYLQNTYLVANIPSASVFFNFKLKRFLSYVMFDQVQQLFHANQLISQGYAAQNAMLRFGFSWTLIN